MSAADVSFIGADNGADASMTEERALFLKMFAGEVLTSFEAMTYTLDKHSVRTISQGKSA
jgi:hypothetical protein